MVGVMATGSLFTIEQIELIRRLRSTGITKKQVVEAFEQLEKLDSELGHSIVPVSSPVHCANGASNSSGSVGGSSYEALAAVTAQMSQQQQQQQQQPHVLNQGSNNLNITITKVESMNPSKTASNPCPVLNGGFLGANSSDITSSEVKEKTSQVQFCPRYGDSFSLQNNVSNDSAIEVSSSRVQTPPSTSASPTSRLPSGLTIIPLTPNGSSSEAIMPKVNDVSLQCLLNPMDFYHDDPVVELDEFRKKGEEAILSEIRSFVMRYNIKQTMIAEMTKLCQAYVSRFFRGDTSDMSEKTKNTFYTWYLTCKNNPWKLGKSLLPQLCPNSGVKRMVSETGDLIPLKRERFTFKAAHLTILERYYDKDPYPDSHTREAIVDECNRAMERLDRPLSEREKVSLPVVNNWFNNRRKEAKKQMRQQHAAAMAVANGLPQPSQASQQSLVGSTPQLVSQLSLPLTCPMSSGNWIPSITVAAAPSSSSQATPTSSNNNSNNGHESNHSSSEDDDDSSGVNYDGSDDVMVIAEDDETTEAQRSEIKTET